MTKPFNTDLMQGTLDMLILRVLQADSLHGWGIAQRIHLLSDDVLRLRRGLCIRRYIAWSGKGLSRQSGVFPS